jgi:hypothetical protein
MGDIRSRTALGRQRGPNRGQSALGIPPQRYYTLLVADPPDPFGFGSQAPARAGPRFPDIPGPGKYDLNRQFDTFVGSTRGRGSGFTSLAPRRLEFVRGTKNPAPCAYEPMQPEKKLKPSIGKLVGRRCACFPDERASSMTPGPGSYDVTCPKNTRAVSSVFRSRSSRALPFSCEKEEPRFNGRTFVIYRGEL